RACRSALQHLPICWSTVEPGPENDMMRRKDYTQERPKLKDVALTRAGDPGATGDGSTAYLPSCHRWACRTPPFQGRLRTTFPSGPGVTGRTASLQVPACPSRTWTSRVMECGLH
ncbi:mCG146278, partial [Mus musculus]